MPDANGRGGGEAALRGRAAELSSVYWHHSIRLFPDLVTRGGKSLDHLSAETERILGPLDLEGRGVLDLGTWNGHYAFEAARRGAAEVTASDSYCWRHPLFRGRETFDLARSCLGLDERVRAVEIDPTDLPGPLQPFDVVLFLGVFYHLYDPIDVLGRVARLARRALVVETHQDLLGLGRPAMAFYPRDELNGDASNWWGPNPECMLELLTSQGFAAVYHQRHPTVRDRGIYHAFRTHEEARALLRTAPDRAGLRDLRSEAGRTGRGGVLAWAGRTLAGPLRLAGRALRGRR